MQLFFTVVTLLQHIILKVHIIQELTSYVFHQVCYMWLAGNVTLTVSRLRKYYYLDIKLSIISISLQITVTFIFSQHCQYIRQFLDSRKESTLRKKVCVLIHIKVLQGAETVFSASGSIQRTSVYNCGRNFQVHGGS